MRILKIGKIFFVLLFLEIFFSLLGFYLLVEPYFCQVKKSSIDKQSIYCLINKTRRKKGVKLVKPNSKLEKAAELRAFDIVTHNQFSHESISGVTKVEASAKAGYHYKEIGELLARRFENNQGIFEAWIKSASHSALILDPHFKEVGIAIIESNKLPENDKVIVGLFANN